MRKEMAKLIGQTGARPVEGYEPSIDVLDIAKRASQENIFEGTGSESLLRLISLKHIRRHRQGIALSVDFSTFATLTAREAFCWPQRRIRGVGRTCCCFSTFFFFNNASHRLSKSSKCWQRFLRYRLPCSAPVREEKLLHESYKTHKHTKERTRRLQTRS